MPPTSDEIVGSLRGSLSAVAHNLTQTLAPQGIDAVVHIDDSYLIVDLRAPSLINQRQMVSLVKGELKHFTPDGVTRVRVRGWRTHPAVDGAVPQPEPLWVEKLTLQPTVDTRSPRSAPPLPPAEPMVLPSEEPPETEGDGTGEPFSAPAAVDPQPMTPTMTLPLWQLLLLGSSIVLIGLAIGVTTRLLTASLGRSPVPGEQVPPPPSPEAAVINQPTAPPQGNQITRAQFDRVTTGMSLGEVEKIFGAKGTLLVQNKAGEGEASVYSWKNPQGSNAIIEFRDGKVIAKAEAGLP